MSYDADLCVIVQKNRVAFIFGLSIPSRPLVFVSEPAVHKGFLWKTKASESDTLDTKQHIGKSH